MILLSFTLSYYSIFEECTIENLNSYWEVSLIAIYNLILYNLLDLIIFSLLIELILPSIGFYFLYHN